jgi:hypothetical protein
MDYFTSTLLIGAGATLIIDAWVLLRRAWLGTPLPDYGMVGRWIGHVFRGRFFHAPIAASPALRGERALGWTAHYVIGIAFAALLVGGTSGEWARSPTPGLALLVGVGTVAAPWFVMQPAMGAGIAARRTRSPRAARLQSLVTHFVFGLGLYVCGLSLRFFLSQ